jgi:putative PEP-CTERM system histidine kinase
LAHVALAILGLMLLEQIYRNSPVEARRDIGFMCIGLGVMFGGDFFVFADASVFRRIDPSLWYARGPLNVLVIPLIAISASRHPRWSPRLFVSRTLVFHSAALVAAGTYLILMSSAGYWVSLQGGEWGGFWQLLFLIGSVILLLSLFFSRLLRSRIKVFYLKHFSRSKYDYRQEWIRVTKVLSDGDLRATLPERIVLALGDLVERPGGAVWVSDGRGGFNLEACVNCDPGLLDPSWDAEEFCRALARIGWILDLAEHQREPGRYPGLEVPSWMSDLRHFSLVVPILHDSRILGFVLLVKPLAPLPLDWETIDLLKTSARQAASYLALEEAATALGEARQFEGFQRVSAFVVHDLKNLVAQLSLVVRNAERHKGNPEFVQDAFATVGSAVEKMNRLLLQLRDAASLDNTEPVDLNRLLAQLAADAARRVPVPVLELDDHAPTVVVADPNRLSSVVMNLITNAQEATDRSGHVWVRLSRSGGDAVIEVEDTGVGMDEDFVRKRLFKPFDSTKGLAGMGIGAYDCREYVRALGGRIEVTSRPGQGTRFRVRIPLGRS